MSAMQEIAIGLDADRIGSAATAPSQSYGRIARLRDWFDAQPIGGKITLFFGFNLAFALAAGLFVIAGYLELGATSDRIRATHDQALMAERLLAQLGEARRHADQLASDNSGERARSARDALDAAESTTIVLDKSLRETNILAFNRLAIIRAGVIDLRREIDAFGRSRGDTVRRQSQALAIASTSEAIQDAGHEMTALLGEDADAIATSGGDLIDRLLIVWIVLAGVLTLITLLAQRYFSRTVALVTGLTYALNPWAVLYSRKIWAQDYHTPFVLLALLLGLYGFTEDGARSWKRQIAQILCLPLLLFALQLANQRADGPELVFRRHPVGGQLAGRKLAAQAPRRSEPSAVHRGPLPIAAERVDDRPRADGLNEHLLVLVE
ncbi:MAG: hypothetical protein HC774_03095 [Sphingomonadales bacterium]|nr:hypothetical protein [Sphingomonadales bacterium]